MNKNIFSEGDEITWSAIVNGKIIRLKGHVSSIVGETGETMHCVGKDIVTGKWWQSFISIYDKSIEQLKKK